MKILHTSDWHIGKSVYGYPLTEDFELFIDWLENTISENKIDVLLIAGDIFDIAFPSNEAQSLYYKTIDRLSKLLKHIVIIGGNHDSGNFLAAPKPVLEPLNVHIFTNPLKSLDDYILFLPNESDPEVVIVAIPYFRNSDLHFWKNQFVEDEQVPLIISKIYEQFTENEKLVKLKLQGIPIIATGHYFVSDFPTISEEDRELYNLGGLLDIKLSELPQFYDYYAFGHVHKPLEYKTKRFYYSGNPFAMGFNDLQTLDKKRVILIDTDDIENPKFITVPNFRQFAKFEGSFDEVYEKLQKFQPNSKLKPYVSVKVVFKSAIDPTQWSKQLHQIGNDRFEVVNVVLSYLGDSDREKNKVNIEVEDMDPVAVFDFLVQNSNYSDQDKKLLIETFKKIYDQIKEQEL